jgi:hypothetical protein
VAAITEAGSKIIRRKVIFLLPGLLILLAVVTAAPSAGALPQVGEPGEGAGQISKPSGVAVDTELGRLYVADSGNLRIDAFDAETGEFEFAFGWGVRNGIGELQTCGPKATPPSSECKKGIAGSGAGQFGNPSSIAVDNDALSPSHHAVYVYDAGNTRVEKFSADGGFLLAFGSKGKAECQFSPNVENGHLIAVGPGGIVHVADTVFLGVGEREGIMHRVEKFDPSGGCIGQFLLDEVLEGEYPNGILEVNGLAVDSLGDVYASFANFLSGPPSFAQGPSVHKYDSSGDPLGLVGQSVSGGALAVDLSDHLFIASGPTIEEFDSSGAELRVFGYGELIASSVGLAPYQSGSGELYVAEAEEGKLGSSRVLYLGFPPPGPLILPEGGSTKADPIGNTKATLTAQVNPEGEETSYHAEYIAEAGYQKNLGEGKEGFFGALRAPATEGEDPSAGADFNVHPTALPVGCSNPTEQLVEEGKCLQPETKYRFRVFAKNADGNGNGPIEGDPFTTKEPIEIIATWSSGVEAESAVLHTEVNPFGIPATGRFQYIAEGPDFQQHGFENAAEISAIDFGAGEEPLIRSAELSGLQPATTYHYRIVASDLFVTDKPGPTQAFRTFAAGAKPPLPDGRTYERVSPAAKNSGEVGVPTPSGGGAFISVEPQQASPDGSRMTYGSFTAFGQAPESAPATSQYLSRLGSPLWTTENINPRFEEGYGRDPLVGFSQDLSHAALITIEPPLTEAATPGFPNLYVRDNETGALTAVTTASNVPKVKSTAAYCLVFGGASSSFDRVVFSARGALNEGDPAGDGFNLYEWSPGQNVKLLSRLPGSNAAAAPQASTGIGASWVLNAERNLCNAERQLMRHAISADGSRVFWTFGGTFKGASEPLFARVDGKETIQLDEPEGVAGNGGGGKYWDASSDGTKVFFTDSLRLTPSSSTTALPDLYRYDFAAPGAKLTNLSAHGGESANVKGVVGASEDGSYVYFVAAGVLDPDPNSSGAVAIAGKENLYVWHSGETRFLATLATEDAADWSIDPIVQSARVTPDGSHLAFISTNSLTGYDNTVDTGSHCQVESLESAELSGSPKCPEAYLYDFAGDQLTCASCNPSKGRPTGPARLPGWSTPYQQPRYLSDDGSRLFFDTLDSLVPRDVNGKRDVYEFERAGSGDCSAASAAFSADSGGCLSLISSGEQSGETTDESYLLDASANGDGVFFSTRQGLLSIDGDGRFDVYDARVGGQPPATVTGGCEGSCHQAGTTAADAPPVGSASFAARPPKRSLECPRGTRKVHRKGKERCLKSKRRHGKHRAQGRRGASRRGASR